ncbi:hypothetical protein V6N13_013526 [Hibiscus sabdariffa]|uniref:Uncharacterized protein n=2 Tax=Hibiscus sabdariffa TaxID=183260 RepID=A0ABR2P216_9ROSI
MILSIRSTAGDITVPSASPTDVEKASAPVKGNTKKGSLSWTDWAKNKISGIENIFTSPSSSGSKEAPQNSPTPKSAPETTVKI